MEIIINGRQAVLKKGSSFEFVAENRAFTGSDSYSLTITFPLRGCFQNQQIFGRIHRRDVDNGTATFSCDIRDKAFFKTGTLTITEISEVEVKCQFLEGRSEQNYNTSFDDIYINELDLGKPSVKYKSDITPAQAMQSIDSGRDFVCLPWVNNTSGNKQNELTRDVINKVWNWADNTTYVTCQPYLLFIAKKICQAAGYTCDFTPWEQSNYRFLIICNTLPGAWEMQDWKYILPHWSLAEFFQQLEYLLWGEFDINHKQKTITFQFTHEAASSQAEVKIEKVVDEFSSEVTDDDESEYLDNYDIAYKEVTNNMWPYLSCQWYIDIKGSKAIIFDTYAELQQYVLNYRCVIGYAQNEDGTVISLRTGLEDASMERAGLFYVKELATYFTMYNYLTVFNKKYNGRNWYNWYYCLIPVNIFGKKVVRKDNDKTIEIGIVPAWIDQTDTYDNSIFLEAGETHEQLTDNVFNPWSVTYEDELNNYADAVLNGGAVQPAAARAMSLGEKDSSYEYFSNIYVAFWDNIHFYNIDEGRFPCPVIDKVCIDRYNNISLSDFSLRLNDNSRTVTTRLQIDPLRKYSFKFLADTLPNPRAVFHIRGKKYVCKKITATFQESGMSQLLKGEFYRII